MGIELTEEQKKMGAVIFKDKEGNEQICYPVKDGRRTVYYPLGYLTELNAEGRVEGD